MRKITLPVLALAAIIVASCAKEKDGYDKNLTSDTWNVSSVKSIEETVTFRDYTNSADETVTNRETTTIENGVQTTEQYLLEQEVGDDDYYEKSTQKADVTITYKFEKEGTFSSETSRKVTSTSYEQTGIPVTTTTQTNVPVTSKNTGVWSWLNTADQKSQLTFGEGAFQVVSINKSELKLELKTSSTQNTQPAPTTAQTVTETNTYEITMTR